MNCVQVLLRFNTFACVVSTSGGHLVKGWGEKGMDGGPNLTFKSRHWTRKKRERKDFEPDWSKCIHRPSAATWHVEGRQGRQGIAHTKRDKSECHLAESFLCEWNDSQI